MRARRCREAENALFRRSLGIEKNPVAFPLREHPRGRRFSALTGTGQRHGGMNPEGGRTAGQGQSSLNHGTSIILEKQEYSNGFSRIIIISQFSLLCCGTALK